ncbi:MAG: DUF4330 domain-containing protein [Oscillospiraceae bacterium]|nr:DUF4330 domain-containing protein [Oscillospiraceae bacterium]MBR2366343.1 DUF4330 domain-containing protein [Oscillospiraceae bacterium]MBR2896285.1 DUF4330 domain-containing protein [Oscillospiraceae bacterium]MBR2976695.1 DUF4330 domain-containing protein [Oscillospiraceae bacterium]MBR3849290.1 DUF4330 domain-containing protein [Oscillospiraceae bacterium]
MKLIKDGRLFGKLNLIDLVVILLVLAVAVSMIVKRSGVIDVDPLAGATQEQIEYKVICRMVSKVMLPDFESAVKRGEQIMSGGELVEDCFLSGEMQVEPFYESYVDADGKLQRAESEDFCNVVFTVSGTAPYSDNAYHVGTQEVRTGKSHILKTNSIEITGNVISLVGIDSEKTYG